MPVTEVPAEPPVPFQVDPEPTAELDPPSFLIIGIWPCLMGLSMYVQQKLNPAPPDPVQAKIFMFFPLFLTVILAPFPSGLVIYWTFNNILTMAQQVIIMKRTTVKTVQK